ncbi:MAG: hypothetical protein HY943_23245 [Gammaproteobacteria bacterium]|nr:hypothetical protein [Gammaproteobacteria bacterium]
MSGECKRSYARQRVAACAALALIVAAAHGEAPVASPEAERGVALLGGALHLGGYATLRVRDLDGEPARFDARGASLLATWTPAPSWQVFVETEIEDFVSIDRHGVNADDIDVTLERLHLDYAATPWLSLRAGKFLTPIGRWNLVHADPLQATVSRPLVTALPFAMLASGLAVHGTLQLAGGDALDYVAYLDASRTLDPAHQDSTSEELDITGPHHEYDHAGGAQLRGHFLADRAELAVSYAEFRMRGEGARTHLAGVDGRFVWRGVELSGEAVYAVKEFAARSRSEWGGFVQSVVPLFGQVAAVARFERYDGVPAAARGVRLGTLGGVWRPRPALALKLEYRVGEHNERVAPDGLLASFGVLF